MGDGMTAATGLFNVWPLPATFVASCTMGGVSVGMCSRADTVSSLMVFSASNALRS